VLAGLGFLRFSFFLIGHAQAGSIAEPERPAGAGQMRLPASPERAFDLPMVAAVLLVGQEALRAARRSA
jgi:hypothetical protein